ncbi:MAG: DUF3035 domain-containing protein, partial [Rhodospirillales bacterium]|nr:DUF3035 domain-containing protein [Rhodospirillales bacterium]
YDKMPPDEFSVVSRAPLSLPPSYTLRPPQPGAARPQEGTVREQARSTLIGGGLGSTGHLAGSSSTPPLGASPAQTVLLNKAGADQVPADIRKQVEEETTQLARADRGLTDKLVFWREPEPYGEVVDPSKETQRLRSNQALGKTITEGDTPIIKRRKKALLEGIF